MVLAAEWGTGQVLWSLIWITLFAIWIILMVRIFTDIFRSHDMSGWAKVAWTAFVVIFPFLGVLSYVLVRGDRMAENELRVHQRREEQFRAYVRDAAGTNGASSAASELERLAHLRERGVIDDDEFVRLKGQLIPAV